MTNEQIETTILNGFIALYGNASSGYTVKGAGTETLTVTIDFPNQLSRVFECEVDSDDDGYFHFTGVDAPVIILIEYPEG